MLIFLLKTFSIKLWFLFKSHMWTYGSETLKEFAIIQHFSKQKTMISSLVLLQLRIKGTEQPRFYVNIPYHS